MSQEKPSQRMVLVECGNCDYEWVYTGETDYAQCPSCQRSNSLNDEQTKYIKLEGDTYDSQESS